MPLDMNNGKMFLTINLGVSPSNLLTINPNKKSK